MNRVGILLGSPLLSSTLPPTSRLAPSVVSHSRKSFKKRALSEELQGASSHTTRLAKFFCRPDRASFFFINPSSISSGSANANASEGE